MKHKTADGLQIRTLYHYTSFDKPECFARIFTEGTIHFSNPKDFNDPWDCRPCYNKGALSDPETHERTIAWFVRVRQKGNPTLPESEHRQHEQELRSNRRLLEWMIDEETLQMERQIQLQYRVFCMSIRADSPLMWSHYGDKHKGICLEFSVRNALFCGALQVEYMKRYPVFDTSEGNEETTLKALLAKSCAWSYEDEFRVVAAESPYEFPGVPKAVDGFVTLPERALRSVIVGCRMPDTERELVRTLVADSGWDVGLKEARIIPDRYDLEIHPLPIR